MVSNVPGPQAPFYLLGNRLEAIYPFVPLSPQNHALSIGVLSYDGRVFFGLAGDRDVLDDIDEFAADLEAALDEQDRRGLQSDGSADRTPGRRAAPRGSGDGHRGRRRARTRARAPRRAGPRCRGSRSGRRRASPTGRLGWVAESASAQQP